MKRGFLLLALGLMPFLLVGQKDAPSDSIYTYKKGDPYGIGKWYMGREIAYVMGFHGMDWLERPERENEEKTMKLIRNLKLEPDEIVADIGAGSGYHSVLMAPLVSEGMVYAVDIQDEMLEVIEKRKGELSIENITTVKGTVQNANLPPNSIDKVLMVDVYHEFNFPKEMMESIHKGLKESGRIYLIEFRKENEWVPIKEVHKMTRDQAVKEMSAAGFVLDKNIGNLPWQHCLVFRKE